MGFLGAADVDAPLMQNMPGSLCIPVLDLVKSVRPGWGSSAASSCSPTPPHGVARLSGGSFQWLRVDCFQARSLTLHHPGRPSAGHSSMSQLSVSVLLALKVCGSVIFWRVSLVQYRCLQPSAFSVRVTSPLVSGSCVLPWEHRTGVEGGIFFPGTHPLARAYGSPCLLVNPSVDVSGIFQV